MFFLQFAQLKWDDCCESFKSWQKILNPTTQPRNGWQLNSVYSRIFKIGGHAPLACQNQGGQADNCGGLYRLELILTSTKSRIGACICITIVANLVTIHFKQQRQQNLPFVKYCRLKTKVCFLYCSYKKNHV